MPPRRPRVSTKSPLHIVFIADDSGSMKGQPAAQVNRAIQQWLKKLLYFCGGQKDYFFLTFITFGSNAKLHGKPRTPLLEIDPKMEPIDGESGGTEFVHPLNLAREILEANPPKATDCPPFVFMYTDGKDEDADKTYAREAARALKSLNQPCGPPKLVVLGCNDAENAFLKELASSDELYFHCQSITTLTNLLPDIGSRFDMVLAPTKKPDEEPGDNGAGGIHG